MEVKLSEGERRDLDNALTEYEHGGNWCGATKIIAHFARRVLASQEREEPKLPTIRGIMAMNLAQDPHPSARDATAKILASVEVFMRAMNDVVTKEGGDAAAVALERALEKLVRAGERT